MDYDTLLFSINIVMMTGLCCYYCKNMLFDRLLKRSVETRVQKAVRRFKTGVIPAVATGVAFFALDYLGNKFFQEETGYGDMSDLEYTPVDTIPSDEVEDHVKEADDFLKKRDTSSNKIPTPELLVIHPFTQSGEICRVGTTNSAGIDLIWRGWKQTIKPGETACLDLQVSIIPTSFEYWYTIALRSHAAHAGLVLLNFPVIDPDYVGTISLMVRNTKESDVTINPNTSIAQLVMFPKIIPKITEVSSTVVDSRMFQTTRFGGLGSTGNTSLKE